MNPAFVPRQEAMAVYGKMESTDLVFDSNILNLEPTQSRVWSRGIALLGKDWTSPGADPTIGYAYQVGATHQTKLAIITVNPEPTKEKPRWKVTQAPFLIQTGETPYLSVLSVPYLLREPHSAVFFKNGTHSDVRVCTVKPTISHCETFMWLQQEVTSLSTVRLGTGRVLAVFSNKAGIPYYT